MNESICDQSYKVKVDGVGYSVEQIVSPDLKALFGCYERDFQYNELGFFFFFFQCFFF
jgi:hypothetical protein